MYQELLNLSLLEVTKVDLSDRQADIFCRSKLELSICPCCLGKCSEVNQSYTRVIRDLDIVGRRVYLHLEVRQFYCQECDHYFSEGFDFVRKNSKVTKRQEKWIFRMCKKNDIKQVAALADMGYKQVEKIYYRYANSSEQSQQALKKVERLGIDEIALRKGHKNFACVLVDIDRGIVINLLPSRDKSFLIKYFRSKGEAFCKRIKIVTCDMWEAYVCIARALFPNAIIIIDRFHWMKHLTDALDIQRKSERKQNPKEEVFKNIKWALIKNQEDLTDKERIALEKAFKKSPELEEIYEMKNTFQAIFNCDFSKQEAEKQIQFWLDHAEGLANKYLDKFVKTFKNWKQWIMNYFEGRYSNGVVEGLNNAIKVVKRRTYGMLNFQHFRARVLIESFD